MLHDLQKGFGQVALANETTAMLSSVAAARGSRERRLGVYRTNTVNSLTDVLQSAFPVVDRIVGERFFRAMALAFVEDHPPQQPTLFRYGARLPTFLKKFPPAQDLPYLSDVAQLEWARIEAYFAPDQAPLDPSVLASISPERLSEVQFSAHPATRLVQSANPIFEIWAVNQAGQDDVPRIDFTRAECGLVVRRGQAIAQRQLTAGAFYWLNEIINGATLGAATDSATAADPAFDLQDTLQLVLADGAFADAGV